MNKLGFFFSFIIVISVISCSKKTIPVSSKQNEIFDASSESELEFQYTFTEANKQLLFGNIKQAALLFSKCIELDSTRSMPYYQLANIYYQAGDSKTALDYSKKAYLYEPSNVWVDRLTIELYRANNNLEDAIKVTEKTINTNTESIEFQFTLASLYHDQGKAKTSLEVLDKIENNFGISEEVSLYKHQIYNELGKEKEAEEVLLNLIELNPNEYRFLGILAEFYSSINKNSQAEEIYDKLLSENADNPYIILSAAEHYRNINNYSESKNLYSKVLLDKNFDLNIRIRTIIGLISNQNFITNNQTYLRNLIDSIIIQNEEPDIKLLTLRADYCIRINDFDSAEKDLIKVLDIDKSNYVIWEQLLYINNSQNDNESLLNYSEQAINYFPEQPNLYLLKGIAEMNLSKYDKAVSSYKYGLKLLQPNDPLEIQFLTFLGDVYRNLGNDKKSDEYFEKVLEMDPNNMIVLNNYSYYLSLRDEKLDVAEKYSKKTVDNDPNNSTYLDTYAWILFKLSRYNDAKKYIEKAINNNGSGNSEILDHYGEILVKLEDYHNAVKYWRLAIENGGEEEVIQQKIESVLNFIDEK